MRDIFIIESGDWELTIMCQDQSARYLALEQTLKRRSKHQNTAQTQIRFSRPLDSTISRPIDLRRPGDAWSQYNHDSDVIPLEAPLLFDNTQYHFHWVFRSDINITRASVDHRLRKLQESFAFKPKRKLQPSPMLVGTINPGNDIGWLRLPLTYEKDGICIALTLSFEVFSAKLDTQHDLQCMYRSIDDEFPLWRFRFARNTEQAMSRSRNRGDFPIMWLAQFQTLRCKLLAGLKVIVNSPHNRLRNHTRYIKADRLKGRVDYKTSERVVNHLAEGFYDRRYARTSKHLSVDTPENRFIKMVVTRTAYTLDRLHQELEVQSRAPEKQLLSDSFLAELLEWQKPLKHISTRTFLAEVGNYSGLKHESQVLHQQAGYSTVYRVWQELRFYLDLFDAKSLISLRSVDEIYEIWCFLELRKILTIDLGFNEVNSDRPILNKRGLELELKDGMAGSFEFTRDDGMKVRLAHEPIFRAATSGNGENRQPIRTYWLTQKPDIFLQASFSDGRQCVWLFDAKYRVDQGSWQSENENKTADNLQVSRKQAVGDLVPEDALNQMHRYRDALIREDDKSKRGIRMKSRPVFGAFALYPGYFDQPEKQNPYEAVIREVGIGAFSLLPSNDGNCGRFWLSRYLRSQLGSFNTADCYTKSSADYIYVQEPPRIPYRGMTQSLYPNLVMVAGLGDRRTEQYVSGFRDGTAHWYHCPVATFDARYSEHVTGELEYLAIASPDNVQLNSSIDYVWQIAGLAKVKRCEISEQQAGAPPISGTCDKHYWLFELGNPIKLHKPVLGFPRTGFIDSLRVTTLSRLSDVKYHSELEDVYAQAVSRINLPN